MINAARKALLKTWKSSVELGKGEIQRVELLACYLATLHKTVQLVGDHRLRVVK